MSTAPMYGKPAAARSIKVDTPGFKPYPWRTQAQVCKPSSNYGPPALPKRDKRLYALMHGSEPTAQTRKRTPKRAKTTTKGESTVKAPSEATVFYCAAPSCSATVQKGDEFCSAHQRVNGQNIATNPVSSRETKTKTIKLRNPDAKRTASQVYGIAARALEVLGYDFPNTMGEASELIQELEGLKVEAGS